MCIVKSSPLLKLTFALILGFVSVAAESATTFQHCSYSILPISLNIKEELPATLRFCAVVVEGGGIICIRRENEASFRGKLSFSQPTSSSELTSYYRGVHQKQSSNFESYPLNLVKHPDNVRIFVDEDRENSSWLLNGYIDLDTDCIEAPRSGRPETASTQTERQCTLKSERVDGTFSIQSVCL